ncbi:MAG: glycosyltransferase family 4 protein, partial [Solirubrobacterales bacterium]|nr:glycosyltransferase family 4 protein [Solirubrobacterales bacterium]
MVVDRLRAQHDVLVLTSDERASEAPPERWIRRQLPLFVGASGDALAAPMLTRRAVRAVDRALGAFAPDLAFIWGAARVPKAAIRTIETAGVPLAFSILDYWFDRPYENDPFLRYLRGDQRGLRAVWSLVTRASSRFPSLRVELSGVTPAAVAWCSDMLREATSVSGTLELVLEQTIHLATTHESVLRDLARKPGKRNTILFVGRLTPEKGPDVALRALAVLTQEYGLDADLVLCGSAQPRMTEALGELARVLGIGDRIHMRGALGSQALAEQLSTAHALIVPSVWQEPFGLVCLEGALARVPVVASRSGAMTEVLLDEDHALFFP